MRGAALKDKAKKKAGGADLAAEPEASAKPGRKKPAAKKRPKNEVTKATNDAAEQVGGKKSVAKKPPRTKAKDATEKPPQTKPKNKVRADPFEVARRTMKGSVPAIVKTMVKMAKEGSCTHAKTLLEMTGAKHMFDGEAPGQESGEPWAKLVLERLDEAESAAEQESTEEESLVPQS